MDLILWRHAEAEPGEPDLGRRLTAKGHKQAERVGSWLDGHLPQTTRILVSPAVGWPDARDPVLIIGHQPTLGSVASFLLAGEEAYWAVRKGAVWWLSNRDRAGNAPVVLRVVIGPDFI